MAPRTILDRFPMPPCARLLGWELLEADAQAGRVTVRFEARPEFCNPAGTVQGGFLAAMLDDAMGPAVVIASGGEVYPATIEMKVSFLAPAAPGRIIAEARILQRGRTIGFLEASLRNPEGRLIATATASARMVKLAEALA